MAQRSMFYVTTPSAQVKRVIALQLKRCDLPASEPYQDVLAVNFNPAKFEQLSNSLAVELAPEDLQRAKCRIVSEEIVPTPADLMQTQSLDNFLGWIRNQWIVHLIRERRLTTFFQPIVDCHLPHRVFAYECLLRGSQPDGELIPPDLLFAAARATDQMAVLDAAAMRVHIDAAAACRLDSRVFINFNRSAVSHSDGSLREIFRAAVESGIPAERFVFEVVESDRTTDIEALVRLLDIYRQQGFQVALDDIGAGYNSLNLLTEIRPDFIKLDMQLINNVDRDPYKAHVAAKLLELAQELEIGTVVEGIETPGQWQWSADHGANYAQGFLFARPAAIPPKPQFRPEFV
jgi:EAL domain-containing protein (putative c-di-GMP-specific phosphodiesterase class I)